MLPVAWNETPEETRAAMCAHARAIAEAASRDAPGSVTRAPVVDIAGAERTSAGLLVTFCSFFRISCLAQSGSDWSEQHVSITETTFGSAAEPLAERVLVKEVVWISERDEDDYDDAAGARAVAAKHVAPVGLRRALEDAEHREALATSPEPLGVLLRRAGAYFAPQYELDAELYEKNARIIRHSIAADPALPFAELAPFLHLGPFAREVVARHPATPPDTLFALAADDSHTVQLAVAARGGLPSSVRQRLQGSKLAEVRARLAGDPGLTQSEILVLARDPDRSVRTRIAGREDASDALLANFVGDDSPWVRGAVLRHPRVTVELLARLADDRNEDVLLGVATHPKTPPDSLAHIAERTAAAKLRVAIARHPAAPRAALERLFAHAETRALIAARPGLSSECARVAARDADEDVRRAVAANTSVDEAILDGLVEDRDLAVRQALAKNPRFTKLADLATDPNMSVRAAVARRADAPREVLDALAADNQTLVRRAAAETLARSR